MEAHNSVIESTLESDETEPVTQVGLDTAITTNALTISKDEPYVMNVGASINAMSSDPALSKVVVAGREVLKIYSTDTLGEVLNIRVGKINMNYSSNDVRWNPNQSHSQYIASAATNGAVVIWNLGSKGKKLERSITDHTRTVNRICWQPGEPNNLLSGSQDGLMKLWDIRDPGKNNNTVTFNAKSEVRDVQFSPFYPFYFAAALDNGNIQIWDMRKPSVCERQITAHQGLILSLSWHPSDMNTLASGGRDRVIKTWDLRTGMKPSATVQTIAIIGRLTWRPSSHGRPWHIASSSGLTDSAVHIWDTKRPFIPLASLIGAKDVTTSHIWTENNNMITASKDGHLRIYDLQKHSYIQKQHITSTAMKFNVNHQLSFISEAIDRKTNPVALEPLPQQRPDQATIQKLFLSGPGPDPTTNQNLRKISIFDAVSASSTSSFSRSTNQTNTSQSMFGSADSSLNSFGFNPEIFSHLAKNYIFHGKSIVQMCEHNSLVCQQVNSFQLAQMWKMLQLIYTSNDQFFDNCSNGHTQQSHLDKPGLETISRDEKELHEVSTADRVTSSAIEVPESTSDVLPSPVAVGARSTEMFSPLQDDWDLQLLDVPSSNREKHQSHQYRHTLPIDLGGFDNPSGLTDHDFLEDIEHPRLPLHTILGDDDREVGSDFIFDRSRSRDNFFGGQAPFAALQAAHILEDQIEWDATSLIFDILEYHQQQGDVQTCVYIVLVLQDIISVDSQKVLAWMIAYIELLHRLQMWNCANDMAKYCHLDNIKNMNKQSTSFATKCASCSKALMGSSGVYCENCKKPTSMCGLCRLPVKGSVVWCPGCGHGGHAEHMANWFASETSCPTGCGHICVLKSASLAPIGQGSTKWVNQGKSGTVK